MGMATILFDGSKPFEQIGNTLLIEGPMWNLVKIAQAVSETKTLHNFIDVYIPGARADNHRGKKFDYN